MASLGGGDGEDPGGGHDPYEDHGYHEDDSYYDDPHHKGKKRTRSLSQDSGRGKRGRGKPRGSRGGSRGGGSRGGSGGSSGSRGGSRGRGSRGGYGHQSRADAPQAEHPVTLKCEHPDCGKEFTYISNYNRHVTQFHTPGGRDIWCGNCLGKFSRKDCLSRHQTDSACEGYGYQTTPPPVGASELRSWTDSCNPASRKSQKSSSSSRASQPSYETPNPFAVLATAGRDAAQQGTSSGAVGGAEAPICIVPATTVGTGLPTDNPANNPYLHKDSQTSGKKSTSQQSTVAATVTTASSTVTRGIAWGDIVVGDSDLSISDERADVRAEWARVQVQERSSNRAQLTSPPVSEVITLDSSVESSHSQVIIVSPPNTQGAIPKTITTTAGRPTTTVTASKPVKDIDRRSSIPPPGVSGVLPTNPTSGMRTGQETPRGIFIPNGEYKRFQAYLQDTAPRQSTPKRDAGWTTVGGPRTAAPSSKAVQKYMKWVAEAKSTPGVGPMRPAKERIDQLQVPSGSKTRGVGTATGSRSDQRGPTGSQGAKAPVTAQQQQKAPASQPVATPLLPVTSVPVTMTPSTTVAVPKTTVATTLPTALQVSQTPTAPRVQTLSAEPPRFTASTSSYPSLPERVPVEGESLPGETQRLSGTGREDRPEGHLIPPGSTVFGNFGGDNVMLTITVPTYAQARRSSLEERRRVHGSLRSFCPRQRPSESQHPPPSDPDTGLSPTVGRRDSHGGRSIGIRLRQSMNMRVMEGQEVPVARTCIYDEVFVPESYLRMVDNFNPEELRLAPRFQIPIVYSTPSRGAWSAPLAGWGIAVDQHPYYARVTRDQGTQYSLDDLPGSSVPMDTEENVGIPRQISACAGREEHHVEHMTAALASSTLSAGSSAVGETSGDTVTAEEEHKLLFPDGSQSQDSTMEGASRLPGFSSVATLELVATGNEGVCESEVVAGPSGVGLSQPTPLSLAPPSEQDSVAPVPSTTVLEVPVPSVGLATFHVPEGVQESRSVDLDQEVD